MKNFSHRNRKPKQAQEKVSVLLIPPPIYEELVKIAKEHGVSNDEVAQKMFKLFLFSQKVKFYVSDDEVSFREVLIFGKKEE